MSLQRLIPDADTFLALPPEELAFYVLQAAQQASGGAGLLHIQGLHNQVGAYPANKQPQIQVVLRRRGNGSRASFYWSALPAQTVEMATGCLAGGRRVSAPPSSSRHSGRG